MSQAKKPKKRVLFLCTHNSARSQMAEALVNHDLGAEFEAFSAGTEPAGVRPETIQVLAEAGLDISGARSKSVDEFEGQAFDYVITLCGQAAASCPVFPGGTRQVHLGFDDPAVATGTAEEVRAEFARIRDEIRERVEAFLLGEAQGR